MPTTQPRTVRNLVHSACSTRPNACRPARTSMVAAMTPLRPVAGSARDRCMPRRVTPPERGPLSRCHVASGILGIVMRLRFRLAGLRLRPHLPRRTFQMRMAMSYWGLFVASGAVLLAVTAALWQGVAVTAAHPARAGAGPRPPGAGHLGRVTALHGSDLGPLLIVSGIALALMAVVSIASGWLVAGRFLRPVRAITAAAKRISATSLHERLNLAGPEDDLKELADTFDGLLARLERSFQFERRFAANASHELRTPLTTMRV